MWLKWKKRAYYYYNNKLLPQINSKLQWIIDSNQANYYFLFFFTGGIGICSQNFRAICGACNEMIHANTQAHCPFSKVYTIFFLFHSHFFLLSVHSAAQKKLCILMGTKLAIISMRESKERNHIVYTSHVIRKWACVCVGSRDWNWSSKCPFRILYSLFWSTFNLNQNSIIFMCISHPSYKR